MADNDLINETADKEDEQFNSMLSAAQKHVGSDGGVGGASGGSLSQAQIEAMLAMGDDAFADEELSSEGEASPDSTDEAVPGGEADAVTEYVDEETAIADKFRESIAADAQEAAEQTEENIKKKKEKKPKVKKEKKPLDKAVIARIITVAAVIVAAALGFCVSLLMFSDLIKSGNEEFAIKAANTVNSKLPLNTEFYIYKAFVRNNSLDDECVIYGITGTGENTKLNIYRVVIEHEEPDTINLYYSIDENDPEYLKLKNSDKSEDRILASRLKNNSDVIDSADREISINDPRWERINCNLVNKYITSKQDASAVKK